MKYQNIPAFIGIGLGLGLACFSSAGAAEVRLAPTPPTATVSGRVQNVVTGQYLNNARVTVRGTDLVAFTDQSGSYHLTRVPSGAVVLEVTYTGLDARQIPLQVAPGQEYTQDVDLTSVARYGERDGVVKLDSFIVATSHETDGGAIAVNEQRYAPNIKSVVAADSLGDVMDGNIGEFLKCVPGVVPEYDYEDGTTVSTVSIRGFAPHMVAVTIDGAQMVEDFESAAAG